MRGRGLSAGGGGATAKGMDRVSAGGGTLRPLSLFLSHIHIHTVPVGGEFGNIFSRSARSPPPFHADLPPKSPITHWYGICHSNCKKSDHGLAEFKISLKVSGH